MRSLESISLNKVFRGGVLYDFSSGPLIFPFHYNDVRMGPISSQITSLTIVYSIVYSDADQRKHQSSASLAFVRGIHRGPVNSPHKWPVKREMFPFDDVIMFQFHQNTDHLLNTTVIFIRCRHILAAVTPNKSHRDLRHLTYISAKYKFSVTSVTLTAGSTGVIYLILLHDSGHTSEHDDVIKWKHFPRYWPCVWGIHRWPLNTHHKSQWRRAFDVSIELRLNKRLSKQSRRRWFDMPSRPFITITSHERHLVPNHPSFDCLFNSLCGPTKKKHQSPRYWPFVSRIHRWPVNSPHKGPVTRKSIHLMTSLFLTLLKEKFLFFSTFIKVSVEYSNMRSYSWRQDWITQWLKRH